MILEYEPTYGSSYGVSANAEVQLEELLENDRRECTLNALRKQREIIERDRKIKAALDRWNSTGRLFA